jgi:dihydroorotase
MTATVIRGGRLYDADAHAFVAGDVLLDGGRVVAKGVVDAPRGAVVLDARGAFVAPGFIDSHVHVFSHPLFRHSRLAADRIGVSQGVACVVDAGSSGAVTIDAFPTFVRATQRTATYAFINIGSPGLPNLGGGHSSRPELLDLPGVVHAFDRHGDWLLGVKVLASGSHTGAYGAQAVRMARKAAELVGKPLMLHIGNAPPVVDDVLDLLRPGDIVTHAYHGKVGGVLTRGDKVLPAFRAAVERGVWVDIAHGRASFAFRTCELALAQGMPVHSISSDLHDGNVQRYVVSLARTMSKMLALGLAIEDVVRAVTTTPARMLGLDAHGFGALAVGGPAHVTVFDVADARHEVEDAEGERRTIERWIVPRCVYVAGERHDATAPI